MNPLCNIRHWSPGEIDQVLKAKGTIQDVDGVCSFKVSSRSRKACDVAAHYRMPLHALNKKFGLYKKVVAHLSASSHDGAARMRNVYVSTMDYMTQVRLAFFEDAAGSENALRGDFRCPALDYYLWLDHHGDGFHNREALRVSHGVTFERVKNSACPDILASREPPCII
jgi:flagellar biosynthesis regulator FlaF